MLLPIRTKNVPEQVPFVTYGLIAVNIVLYFATSDSGLQISERALAMGGLSFAHHEWFRFISSTFLHGNLMHIIGNMLFLWIFGCAVEGRLGWWKYSILYVVAGVAGDLLHLGIFGAAHPEIPSIGASGAIFGIVGAALYIFPFAPITFVYALFMRVGTVDWPLWCAATYYLGLNILDVILTSGSGGAGGVANLAHLGGALGGVVVAACFRPKRDSSHVSEAKASFAETRDYRTLSRMQLTDMHELQPVNHDLLLHLIVRAQRDGQKLDQKYWDRFAAALPQLVVEGDNELLLPQVLMMSSTPGVIPARILQKYADRLEKEGQPQPAFQLYDRVAHDSTATQPDWENSLFRMGQIREMWFQDFEGAKGYYDMFMQHYPMSSMAQHVQERLRIVSNRVPLAP